jgi:hypothetical protein
VSNAELARETIAILDRDGWNKGSILGADGTHCIAGALNIALHGDCEWTALMRHPVYDTLAEVVTRMYPDRRREYELAGSASRITGFNNHPATTLEDVKAVLNEFGEVPDAS